VTYRFLGREVKKLIAHSQRAHDHVYTRCEALERFGKAPGPPDAEPALFLVKADTVYLMSNVYPPIEERIYAEGHDEFTVEDTIDFVESISLDMFPALSDIRDNDTILIDISGYNITVTIG